MTYPLSHSSLTALLEFSQIISQTTESLSWALLLGKAK